MAINADRPDNKAAGQRWRPLGTFTVGAVPRGVAFDGANIWVANSKQRQRDQAAGQRWRRPGHLQRGTAAPSGVAFDGANIWVANNGSDNVTKLRASDGATLGTFTVGMQPDTASPLTAPTSGWQTMAATT